MLGLHILTLEISNMGTCIYIICLREPEVFEVADLLCSRRRHGVQVEVFLDALIDPYKHKYEGVITTKNIVSLWQIV
jgi:hypothetical protein